MITETDDVARALDDAARRWPDDRHDRRRLLLHLVVEGHRAALEQDQVQRTDRQAMVSRTSGALSGLYSEDYLHDLRGDWPE